jgi:hypothetical protein
MGRRAERRREAARRAAEDERARQVQRQAVLADHLPRHLREGHGREAAEAGGDPGGGITHSGPETVNISGQAVGSAGDGPREPRGHRVAGHRAASERGGGPLIQNTGRGQINIADSVIGGKHVTEHQAGPGDSPKAPETDREAG